jgi:RNA polymerase sigma-70 factor (ECF subfamily)
MNETGLVEGLVRKDEDSFRHLIRLHQSGLKSLAVSIVGERIADEVVQEAWISVMAALPKFEGRSSLKTWIFRIVANESKTRLRKERRTVSLAAMLATDKTMEARFNNNSGNMPNSRNDSTIAGDKMPVRESISAIRVPAFT